MEEVPSAVEITGLVPGAQREDGLAAVVAPSHSRALHAHGGGRLASSLDDAGADGEVAGGERGVGHPVPVFPNEASSVMMILRRGYLLCR